MQQIVALNLKRYYLMLRNSGEKVMAQSVRLDDKFVDMAKVHATAANRSVPKQIEYMAKIGQIAITNPELSYNFIKESLLAEAELELGMIKPYERRTKPGVRKEV